MKLTIRRQCPCCKGFFFPDRHNAHKQVYCSKPECRKASKATSQRRWTLKNPDYFKDPLHADRVRDWRLAHPGRYRGKTSRKVLQDHCTDIIVTDQDVSASSSEPLSAEANVLQDFVLEQHPVFVGLIAHLTGSLLQDDIAEAARRLEQLGHDVIASTPISGGHYEPKNPGPSRPHPHRSRSVQLGGPPPGA